MTHDQLLELYEKSERFFWSSICVATAQIRGIEMFASGVNNRYLNSAIQRTPLSPNTFQSALDSIQAFFKIHNIPWVWIIREDLIPSTLITTHALELLDKSTAMVCDLSNPSAFKSADTLRYVENNGDLTDWGECLRKAYETPTETAAQYLDVVNHYIRAHKSADWQNANFHHFVGYLDTIPVSCLTLSIQENRARIDDVGTIPEHQHKGYATQLVAHALHQAKTFGADICFLESSEKGIKVYEKLGFQALFSNMYFEFKGSSVGF